MLGKYHIVSGNRKEALHCRDLLNELEPGSIAARCLERCLKPENARFLQRLGQLRGMFHQFERDGAPPRQKAALYSTDKVLEAGGYLRNA